MVVTADKNPHYLNQVEDQMVEQITPFQSVTKYNCCLPLIRNENDRWYCKRLINEALLEIGHHGNGPVHIDVPIEEGMFAIGNVFTTKDLPEFELINRYELSDPAVNWDGIFSELREKRIMR